MKTRKSRARRKGRNESIPFDWSTVSPQTRAWLAQGCPATHFLDGRRSNVQPATCAPATGGQ